MSCVNAGFPNRGTDRRLTRMETDTEILVSVASGCHNRGIGISFPSGSLLAREPRLRILQRSLMMSPRTSSEYIQFADGVDARCIAFSILLMYARHKR